MAPSPGRFALLRRAAPFACAALPLGLGAGAQGVDREGEARVELERAEALASRAQYAAAAAAYRRLAASHPETAAGKVAERRSQPSAFLGWTDLLRHGPSSNRVDVVVMGDGYTLKHQDAFDDVAKAVPSVFERNEVFGEYFSYFNFLRANLASADDGVDGFGREYDTALNGRMSGALQGQVTVDHRRVREMLDEMPEHDGLAVVFVRVGTLGTGGGGVAVIGGRSDGTLVHEWGHAFAGLADEYASDTGHRGAAANRINVSASDDPSSVPWRHWLEAKVRGVGIYEGADGRVQGAWRPTSTGCAMESGDAFCRVCREALVLAIHARVDPIDGCSPEPHPLGERRSAIRVAAGYSEPDARPRFEVTTMRPRSHAVDVEWFVVPADRAPAPGEGASAGRDRRARGPLPGLPGKPFAGKRGAAGVYRFEFDPRDFGPGLHRVVARARDATRLRGERWPWVLRDDGGLLESERGWWVLVAD